MYIAISRYGRRLCETYVEACAWLDIIEFEEAESLRGFSLSFPPFGGKEVRHESLRYRNYTDTPEGLAVEIDRLVSLEGKTDGEESGELLLHRLRS
jgi:hypothetical protein